MEFRYHLDPETDQPLRHQAPSPAEVAVVVTRVLRRNEESRIYHWHKATGEFPPRRPMPDSSYSEGD